MDKFEELAKKNGLSLMRWDSENFASENTQLAKDFYEGGQQSRQAEVDQLNEVLDERTKEWLEAIELGTYFQDVAKPLKDEVDELQSQINEMAEVGLSLESELNKKDEYANNLYYENANLQTLVEEKDKRIEEACESINSFFDNQVSTPTPREYANFIAEILEVLRGEHE